MSGEDLTMRIDAVKLYKMVASMKAAIFNCQYDQMQTAKAVVKPFMLFRATGMPRYAVR